MQKYFKLNLRGFIGLETLLVTLLMLLILLMMSAFAFELIMFQIRLNNVKNVVDVACERIQLELVTEEASLAKASLLPNYESEILNEVEYQLGGHARLISAIWSEEGICPLGGEKDDALLHIVVAFEHTPSFFIALISSRTGRSVHEFKIHIDREIELDV